MKKDFNDTLKNFFLKTSPFSFCLILFLLSRVLFWQQAAITNSAFNLHLSPVAWFWQWDSNWYNRIIQNGYDTVIAPERMVNYVFFPLLPLVVGFLSKITTLPVMWMGQIFSQICFLLSLVLFYKVLILRLNNENVARFGTLLLAFSPCNIYFSSFYTESLFLVLSLSIWLLAFQQKWLWVGILGMLLTATRPNGVMVLLPLLYIAYEQYKAHTLRPGVIFLILVPVGLLAFMTYLHYHVGSAMAFVENEKIAWHHPGLHLSHPALYGKTVGTVSALAISLYLTYRLIKAKYLPEAWYFLALVIIPSILSGNLLSFVRFSASSFTFYFALALMSENKRYLRIFLLALFMFYDAVFVTWWVNSLNLQ